MKTYRLFSEVLPDGDKWGWVIYLHNIAPLAAIASGRCDTRQAAEIERERELETYRRIYSTLQPR